MRSRIVKMLVMGCVTLGAFTVASNAAILTEWTFETSVPTTAGPLAAETGTGSGTALHASGSTVYSNPVGNASNESWSSNFWDTNDYYQFQTSTTGEATVFFSLDQTRSSTGPADFKLQYSTNGTTFTDLLGGAYNVPLVSWSSGGARQAASFFSYDISAVGGNQAAIYIRVLDTSATSATAGTNRVDNVAFSNTPVVIPEPTSLALLGLGGLALSARRRRLA